MNNFEKFASLLFMNKEITHGIKDIINYEQLKCFKENLIDSDKILSYIDNFESCNDEVKAVYSFNLIKTLHDSFANRFSELKSNSFVLKSVISEEELHAKSNDLFEQYTIGFKTTQTSNFKRNRKINEINVFDKMQ